MQYYIYIDESGTSSLNDHKKSTHFSLVGVVIAHDRRQKLKEELEQLKLKYFGKKSYILHGSSIRRDLRSYSKDLTEFAKDLEVILTNNHFFLLCVTVDKQKAINWSWQKSTVLKRSYRHLINSLVGFLVGKSVKGGIVAEASSIEKDIEIYKSFFHFIANGIPELKISSEQIKKHLTSVSFVTKNNDDAEEQIADLFGVCGKIDSKLKSKETTLTELDPLAQTIYKVWHQKLFHGKNAQKEYKKRIYHSIKPFIKLP